MRVLFVEDSVRLQRSVGTGLRKAGFAVDVTGNGEEGLWHAETNDYDVVVLDLMLPGLDGLSILKQLREQGNSAHVLLLTAKDTVEDRVRGLRMGADDYLIKPFAFEELLARVNALARRNYGKKNPRLGVGDLVIDTAGKTVTRNGRPIDLAPREYKLLEYLAHRPGEVVTRTEIESHIYDERAEPMTNVVDATVYALRKKLGVSGAPPLIHTRRGVGYLLSAPGAPSRPGSKENRS